MKRRRRILWCVAALAATVAQATTMEARDVEALTRESQLVVRARVLTGQARWTADRARIVTDTEVEVLETWKGEARRSLVVMQPGGVVGDLGQRVAGAATFTPGEEVVLFLEARGGAFTVSAMSQGVFRVEAGHARRDFGGALVVDPVTHRPVTKPEPALDVATLEARVRAAARAPASDANPPATRPPLVPR